LVTELGLEDHVKFYDQYLNLSDLFSFESTDIYISTSINPNQAVSGTLSYALGSGRTVVSTQFAQAKELVTQDSGRLVPIKNPLAISEALLDLLSDEQRLKDMHTRAYAKTRTMLWSNVAEKYTSLLSATMIPAINFDIHAMTDDFGLFQLRKWYS
jgi:glycosyltransferase involved in cell wall biosynthesis